MSAGDLKQMPIFDNDYLTAMSAFLDSGEEPTSGSGLMVDGVESNRVTVSPSAVQEIRINQDPYSAQYYDPGRGQIEIITKPTAAQYHGQFNFTFRDNSLNAQQDFSPNKPYEQRRIYEGFVTGPVPHSKNTAFLLSANRAEEDLDAVVNATIVPTPENPNGIFQANVPAPTRDTEFSIRLSHVFGAKNNAYAEYAYQDSTNTNEGAGNQTLAEAAYNAKYREDDLIFHDDGSYSPRLLNQVSLVFEHWYNSYTDAVESPRIIVQGNFTGGSAQADQLRSEYNVRFNDKVSWTRGAHTLIYGITVPHFSRRVLDDQTNALGTYTFSSLASYEANQPSGYSLSQGQVRFVFPQQEVGAYIQDQIKLTPRFSITPGVRYDWQNFISNDTKNFAPRASFALVLDQKTGLVLRGGGGVYFDRTGSSPIQDIARYSTARRRLVQVSSQQQSLCVPITLCVDPSSLPPSLVERAPNLKSRTPSPMASLSIANSARRPREASASGAAGRMTSFARSTSTRRCRRPTPAAPIRTSRSFARYNPQARISVTESHWTIAAATTNTSRALANTPGANGNRIPMASTGFLRTSSIRMRNGRTPVGTSASVSASTACSTPKAL